MNKNAIPLSLRRHKLVASVRERIENKNVVVGVSGGADSVALLLLCCAAASQESANFSVLAAHVHHGIRKESDDELEFVESLCKTLGIECVSKRIKVKPLHGSLAAGARKMRYEVLHSVAINAGFNVVSVAHHAEDQLETMLMALCRGGGLRKLSGIAAVRPLGNKVNLVRPLLHVEKKELIDICELANIQWCEDQTNLDPSTPRGRLRRDVIPVLCELWSSANRHAANASTLLHSATDVFLQNVPEGNEWDRKRLAKLPLAVIDATLQQAIGEIATFETIQSISKSVVDKNTHARTFQLKNGCETVITSKTVTVIHS
jgi:tRNA(Ile)-lysidine synthetase-like protein